MDKIVGTNIKLLREKLGLTQEAVALYLDVTRQQFIRYEKGETSISSDKLTKLSDLFSVDEYDFYDENLSNIQTNLAFAFRANNLTTTDLQTIAEFKTIAKNYLKMKSFIHE